MPKFFYTDCVITDLKQIDFRRDEFSARINGRTAKRLAMSNEIYHSLFDADRSAKSRVWFYASGFKKALVIAAVQPADQQHNVLRNRSLNSPYKMLFRTLLVGLVRNLGLDGGSCVVLVRRQCAKRRALAPNPQYSNRRWRCSLVLRLLAVGQGKNGQTRQMAIGGSGALYPGNKNQSRTCAAKQTCNCYTDSR